ncbi:dihydrofolate reductase family protein [Streptomyces antimicrobicus]|uniref:Dihydrofolate reductase family protein n=1 Tax=Streptomyces antimicrobicus TaxID=2883108 RepID=A0ABS8B4B9_9ACTN|nr:dihydrofolate reductase family protein [Streptomyces antimicrobicus]MCB5179453.1 dihydrofolate reductase family protein [Streptomyces antimicrobicus]
MGKLTLTTFVTLDGVMQAPGGPDEDPSDGFPYGGWQVPLLDDEGNAFVTEVFDRAAAFLLGRRTYEIFAAYWPAHDDPDSVIAHKLNALPKYVASTSLKDPAWGPVTVLDGELQAEIVRVKDGLDGELQVWGSGRLAQYLLARDLVEEFHLLVHPVFLGKGRRLFPSGGLPTACELVASRTTTRGTAVLTYRPTGRAAFGSFAD